MSKMPIWLKLFIGNIGYSLFRLQLKIKGKKPSVVDEDGTVAFLLKNKCSVARFGDGEFLWMLQKRQSGNFEKNSPELAKRLYEVLTIPKKDLIICIPNVFSGLRGLKKKTRTYWEGFFIKNGNQVIKLLPEDKKYFDTQFTRPYMDYLIGNRNFKNKFREIQKIWNNRNLLIVEGEQSRFGVNSDLISNAKSIKRILCPSKNAFEIYDKILASVQKEAQKIDDVLILVSLGPAATLLAFDLCDEFQTIDIGHLDVEYNWFKMHASRKVAIPGKYVNELKNKKFISELSSDELLEYKKQIISKID